MRIRIKKSQKAIEAMIAFGVNPDVAKVIAGQIISAKIDRDWDAQINKTGWYIPAGTFTILRPKR